MGRSKRCLRGRINRALSDEMYGVTEGKTQKGSQVYGLNKCGKGDAAH